MPQAISRAMYLSWYVAINNFGRSSPDRLDYISVTPNYWHINCIEHNMILNSVTRVCDYYGNCVRCPLCEQIYAKNYVIDFTCRIMKIVYNK